MDRCSLQCVLHVLFVPFFRILFPLKCIFCHLSGGTRQERTRSSHTNSFNEQVSVCDEGGGI